MIRTTFVVILASHLAGRFLSHATNLAHITASNSLMQNKVGYMYSTVEHGTHYLPSSSGDTAAAASVRALFAAGVLSSADCKSGRFFLKNCLCSS